jgi:hypothetical protein
MTFLPVTPLYPVQATPFYYGPPLRANIYQDNGLALTFLTKPSLPTPSYRLHWKLITSGNTPSELDTLMGARLFRGTAKIGI